MLTKRLTQKDLDKAAKQEREEILRLIWDAVEADFNPPATACAQALYYRVKARQLEA